MDNSYLYIYPIENRIRVMELLAQFIFLLMHKIRLIKTALKFD